MPKEDKVLADVIAKISKTYGEDTIVQFGAGVKPKTVPTFSTGLPSLDLILGGGIPKGRIIEVYGPEASGKSTLALHLIKQAQIDDPDKKVAYIDAENAFDADYAERMGVVLPSLFLNQPNNGEQALEITKTLCETNKISLIIIDSVACLIPKATEEKAIDGGMNIGTTARMLSQAMGKIVLAAGQSDTTIVFINQIRMKIGEMYGNPETTMGGLALRYAASVRLDLRGKPKKTENDTDPQGIDVTIRVKKNKIAPPFRHTSLFLEYGKGFDVTADLLDTAIGLGIIEKNGGWFQYGEKKVQGWDKFMADVRADEALLAEILGKIKEVKA